MKKPVEELVEIMQTLRGPDGCDWDREQSLLSLKKYLLEESYELVDAIDNLHKHAGPEEINHHREELGDLLLQVVFQAQIQKEASLFSFDDVAQAICDKLRRRHPHIFGAKKPKEKVEGNPYWHKVKEAEQKNNGIFDSIAKSQPALLRARKLGEKAKTLGFDWASARDGLKKIDEELLELKEAIDNGDTHHAHEELGDLLHAIAQVARHLDLDPELALHQSNEKFVHRFLAMLDLTQGAEGFKKLSENEQLELWNRVKMLHRKPM